MALKLKNSDPDFEDAFAQLLGQKRENDADVSAIVSDILKDVRMRGDAAVLDYTNKFDRLSLSAPSQMKFSREEIDAAIKDCDTETLEALKIAAKRIEAYHLKQKPENLRYEDESGIELGYRWTAIEN
ncbi:MAG: histidinol dehydrogenase, partial [Sneathiella sp.]|nr:histidinol dehydrogenase [Sneathiella sp.]